MTIIGQSATCVISRRLSLATTGEREFIPFVIPAQAGIQLNMLRRNYYIYILASKRNGTLYIGVTNDLARRIQEHKLKLVEGFTKKYNVDRLALVEEYNDINQALAREKQLKKWNRKWKIELIEKNNPNWLDLSGY